METRNILAALAAQAAAMPGRDSITFLADDDAALVMTPAHLLQQAAGWGHYLHRQGVAAGETVLIVLDHDPALFYAFLGCMSIGAVPAFFAPPASRTEIEYYVNQSRQMVQELGVAAIVTMPAFAPYLQALLADTSCRVLDAGTVAQAVADLPADLPLPAGALDIPGHQTAYLQFSSGTTGAKKGVMTSHNAVVSQIKAFNQMLAVTADEVIVSWLPLHHDMGLLSSFLVPLLLGSRSVIMSPLSWIRNPKRLLGIVQQYRGTFTCLPNFAFNHMVRAVRPHEIEGVDLRSWRQILNGSEPIRAESIATFEARFHPYGLGENVVTTGYGMAENTLAIALKPHDEPLQRLWVNLDALQRARQVIPLAADAAGVTCLVASGRVVPGTRLKVVDETGRALPPLQVGEICLQGDSLFTGYHRQPEMTAAVFNDGWFHTGDLGFVADGWVYVTGRQKDLIIVGGKNIHPEDLEEIAGQVPGVYPGRVVAFGLYSDRLGTEQVVIVAETRQPLTPEENHQLAGEIRRRVAQQTEITPRDVRIVSQRWVQKSSSGKVARRANREQYENDFLRHA